MEYCKYCGRQLNKEGRCSCDEFKESLQQSEKNVKKDKSAEKDTEKNKKGGFKKGLMIIGVSAVLVVILAVIIMIVSGINAYKKPIKTLVKGINKADTEMLMESVYNEDTVTVKRVNTKNDGTAWKDYLKQSDKNLESKLKDMGLKDADCEIIAKEKLSGSNLKKIEEFYEDKYEAEVKKAYRVEVNFTFKINGGGNETPSGWICVVKLKGEGWKFCPEYSEKHFDFVDTALNFE